MATVEPWHARAVKLRAGGHTIRFIAGQLGVAQDLVDAFIVRLETEQDARRNVQMPGTSERILPRNRLSRPW